MSQTTLQLDPRNTNRGTERGGDLLRQSVEVVDYGRSGVISSDGVVLAGNHLASVAAERGDEPIIIDTDGSRPVFLRRTDLLASDPKAVALGILDNRTAQLNINPDLDLVKQRIEEAGLEVEEMGYDPLELEVVEIPVEGANGAIASEPAEAGGSGGGGGPTRNEAPETLGQGFGVLASCNDQEDQKDLYERMKAEGRTCRLSMM